MSEWPFGDLARGHYGVILADPPWLWSAWSPRGEAKSPQTHYMCMDLAAIQALPVAELAATDAALVMWATAPMLPQAIATLAAWGFEYKSAGAWAKRSKTGRRWHMGTGYVLRSAVEFWLIGTRGSPDALSRSVRNLIVAPVRQHSRKPPEAHHLCETLFSGPRLELFGRARRRGWDVWGNQTDLFTSEVA
jgi:N6-adenosine-specific RNA methylase IME4